MTLINTPKEVEKWLVDHSMNANASQRTQVGKKEGKQIKGQQKEYGTLINYYEDVDDSFADTGKLHREAKSQEKNSKEGKVKVKTKDLTRVINILKTEEQHRKPTKSSKQKRDIFTDGWKTADLEEPRKRIVTFTQEDLAEKKPNPHVKRLHSPREISSLDVKRYQSPREISSMLEESHSPTMRRKKQGRTQLREENPVDLGSVIRDRLSSFKKGSKNTIIVKPKMPFFNGSSKKYNISKEHGAKYETLEKQTSKPKHAKIQPRHSEDEIFISLEKKSPEQKKKLMNEKIPEIFSKTVENDEISNRRFSIDGNQSNSERETLDYSELNNQDEMLF